MSTESFCTYETAWCPGCGNFVILECLKTALEQLGKDRVTTQHVLCVGGAMQAMGTSDRHRAPTTWRDVIDEHEHLDTGQLVA